MVRLQSSIKAGGLKARPYTEQKRLRAGGDCYRFRGIQQA